MIRGTKGLMKNIIQPLLDGVFLGLGGDGQFPDQEGTRRAQHPLFPEGKVFLAAQVLEIAENLGDLESGPSLEFFVLFLLAAIPGKIQADIDLAVP